MKKITGRTWLTLILVGLVGQLAWTIENMYFNVYLYNTISTDPGYISAMVGWSAAAATLTTLLMGALWSLSKLSGTCELTGMLQSGRSLLRVCRPVFYVASLVALAYGICGFHWAPNGSLYRQLLLKQAPPSGQEKALVFRSEKDARIWRIAKPAPITNPGKAMEGVIIEQFDADNRGALLRQYFADSATWNKADSTWTLHNAYERDLSHAHEVPVDDRFLGTCTLPFDELSRFLKEKGAERALDIHIQRQDIFEAMHRI